MLPQAPPQLWKLDWVKDSVRLSLRHTYMPKVTVDFAGPSYFGGKNDQLVLCAGKGLSGVSMDLVRADSMSSWRHPHMGPRIGHIASPHPVTDCRRRPHVHSLEPRLGYIHVRNRQPRRWCQDLDVSCVNHRFRRQLARPQSRAHQSTQHSSHTDAFPIRA